MQLMSARQFSTRRFFWFWPSQPVGPRRSPSSGLHDEDLQAYKVCCRCSDNDVSSGKFIDFYLSTNDPVTGRLRKTRAVAGKEDSSSGARWNLAPRSSVGCSRIAR
eukprot:2332311-Lingulodinium_polyedra.AAC.1